MDFFKSVFSDDPEDSNPQTTPTQPPILHPISNPNPNPDPDPTRNAWSFGTNLWKTLATKSESVIDTYRRDLEEFSSGLKKESEVIRKAASKAVKDLPGTFEAGAAVAQEKLESVGQVIDDFTEIIARNKDILVVNVHDEGYDGYGGYDSGIGESSGNVGVKAYSRVDALVRGVECDLNTYIRKVEDVEEFEEWKRGFVLEERAGEIEEMVEGNGVIREIFEEVVPGKVEEEVFWERLFFRVWKVRKAEEARSRLVRRAISGEDEEEELSWDVDEEEFEECEERTLQRGDVVEGKGGKLEVFGEDGRGKSEIEGGLGSGDDEVRESDGGVDEGRSEKIEVGVDKEVVRTDEKVTSEGKTDSDISVISSQLSPEEEDLGWDEIEDIGSGDEHKVSADGSPNKADLRKRLSAAAAAADEEEDLTWDIEDDDEPVKS